MPFVHVIQWSAVYLQFMREFPAELEFYGGNQGSD
jgi:hypothetical protein